MNTLLSWGTKTVVLALISYAVAFWSLHRTKRVEKRILVFQSLGLFLDIGATCLMILGSRSTPFSLHGFFGYSALLVMMLDTFLVWRFRIRKGEGEPVPGGLLKFARSAFIWWVLAFIIGALMVILT